MKSKFLIGLGLILLALFLFRRAPWPSESIAPLGGRDTSSTSRESTEAPSSASPRDSRIMKPPESRVPAPEVTAASEIARENSVTSSAPAHGTPNAISEPPVLTKSPTAPAAVPVRIAEGTADEAPKAPAIIIPPKEAKGGVYALYRAVLWRDPDPDGGRNATNLFSTIGWSTYIENSRNMITSPEFEERIAPHYEPTAIINRIYSVFLGRCPHATELEADLERFENREPGQITESVLRQTKPADVEQIFKGGHSPAACAQAAAPHDEERRKR